MGQLYLGAFDPHSIKYGSYFPTFDNAGSASIYDRHHQEHPERCLGTRADVACHNRLDRPDQVRRLVLDLVA
jgi:hypothetical protein